MKISKFVPVIKDFYNVIIKDPQRKNIFIILFEYLKLLLTDTSLADQYFRKYFYRKGFKDFNHYVIPLRKMFKLWELDDKVYTSILTNKLIFERYFSRSDLRLAKILAYNVNSVFFLKDRVMQINTLSEFIDLLQILVNERSLTKGIFIKKTEDSHGGRNTFKITDADLVSDSHDLNKLFDEVRRSGYLFQELVIQHKLLSDIYPGSLNTIRFDTYTDRNNITYLYSAFLRMGVNKSYVDNISSGGICIGINMDNGSLLSEAISDVVHGKGKIFKIHPDTGFRLEGFKIPFFSEAGNIALKAAKLVPQLKVLGWDLAIQEDGPILIEGNTHPGIYFSEMAQKGFYNNQVVLKMIREVD